MPNRTYVRHLLLPERCSGVSPSQAQAAGYPMVNVRDIESGKVRVTRELFGAD